MKADNGRGFKSKADWLEAGLGLLSEGGVDRVKVDVLARRLGIARSGFYWHFGNRQNFLDQLIDFWAESSTGAVTDDLALQERAPRDRLITVARLVRDRQLARYDLAVRNWAVTDEKAERVVRAAFGRRRDYVAAIFRELGFEGIENDSRVSLFVCFHIWNGFTYFEPTPDADVVLAKQVDLLISSNPKP